MRITTESFGEKGALYPQRTVQIGSKEFTTPTNAIRIDDTREHEQVSTRTRGVNELYKEVKGSALRKERKGVDNPLSGPLKRAKNKTNNGEIDFCFFSYPESNTLPVADAATMVRLLKRHSDVLTVPLLPEIADGIGSGSGTSDPAYRSYKKSVLRFLEQADQIAPEMPVVGIIPLVGWKRIEDLLDIYMQREVRAYAVNFNRRQVTAENRLPTIRSLMSYPASRGLEEFVLFYAINLDSKRSVKGLSSRAADDMAAYGMGFDVIGGMHVGVKMPPTEIENFPTNVFTLFDKSEYAYRDIELNKLPAEFPDDSSFDPDHVVRRTRNSPKNARYRLQRLVNSEQMAFAIENLREEVGENTAIAFVSSKSGIDENVVEMMGAVRDSFDEEREQSGLSDFDD